MPLLKAFVMTFGLVALIGCRGRTAPTLELFGAYFPDWLLYSMMGVLFAVLARILMVKSQLQRILPFQLLLCVSIGMGIAAILWLI